MRAKGCATLDEGNSTWGGPARVIGTHGVVTNPVGTQGADSDSDCTHGVITNPVGTQGADSDSDCNEQVIIVPSYPSHSILRSDPKDTSGDEVDESPLHFADENFQTELARLKGQAQRATSDAESLGLGFVNDAEELQSPASAKSVPPGCIPVPVGNVPVPPGSLQVPTGGIPVSNGSTAISTDNVPDHTSPFSYSSFDDEPTTRFPSPSDLGNHDPSPGIFSSSSYDDEFGAALNNVASTVEVTQALEDPSWVDAMQEEMQQFKFQNVWVLVDLPEGKYAIGTKWILKNKRDARGIVVRNKARLVAQGHRQEKGIDYDEVFAHVARIETVRLSMIGSLMYLTALEPDIMFAVNAYSRNQVTPTTLNLEAVKKIFKYLKGQPRKPLWLPLTQKLSMLLLPTALV
nr:ribonuclease H-like domain, reverse transcriptase, RNA-dependent DNA polymerase [Tanacetum cinerariifolium]